MYKSAPGGNRTPDLDVRTVLLYPLSYGGDTLEESIGALRAAPLSYGGGTLGSLLVRCARRP